VSDDRPITRRTALTATGSLAVAGGTSVLAGCASSSGAASTPPATPSTVSSTAPTLSSAAPTVSSTASGAPAGAGAGAAALATLAAIPVGSAVAAKDAAGKPIVVAQPAAGRAAAFSAICTHLGCTVAPAGKELHCPCHGSVFDAATGTVVHGPAPAPLAAVPVHVRDGKVFAGTA